MYKVNKVRSQTGKSDSRNYFVRGPITALSVSVRLRRLDRELINIGRPRRARERESVRLSVAS